MVIIGTLAGLAFLFGPVILWLSLFISDKYETKKDDERWHQKMKNRKHEDPFKGMTAEEILGTCDIYKGYYKDFTSAKSKD